MTVDELIEELLRVKNRKRKVMVSIDSEGNGFRSPGSIEEMVLVNDEDVKYGCLTPEMIEDGWGEEDIADPNDPGNEEVLVLW